MDTANVPGLGSALALKEEADVEAQRKKRARIVLNESAVAGIVYTGWACRWCQSCRRGECEIGWLSGFYKKNMAL